MRSQASLRFGLLGTVAVFALAFFFASHTFAKRPNFDGFAAKRATRNAKVASSEKIAGKCVVAIMPDGRRSEEHYPYRSGRAYKLDN
jgi:hypothetical protein